MLSISDGLTALGIDADKRSIEDVRELDRHELHQILDWAKREGRLTNAAITDSRVLLERADDAENSGAADAYIDAAIGILFGVGALETQNAGQGHTVSVKSAAKRPIVENLVFLEDEETFSPVLGATVLAGDYSAQYDLNAILRSLSAEQMMAARLPAVNEKSVAAANEGFR